MSYLHPQHVKTVKVKVRFVGNHTKIYCTEILIIILKTMDNKKRLKRTKINGSDNQSSGNAEADYPDMCSSSDFPSSQECFSVGWDWSGQRSNKPSIRVIERPVQRRNESVELLQCQRKRQFVNKCDPDMFDSSVLVDQLKSLAAGFKCKPESTSPVASPPHSVRRRDLVVTPTVFRKASACSTSVESSSSCATPTSSENSEDVKENLFDLLDDSLGADLLKCTQDVESGCKQKELHTPTLQDLGPSSSKRKHRLSLSSKKDSKTVVRRINDIYEKQAGEHQKASKVHQDKENNNKNDLSKDDFDDLDDAALLSLGDLEEKKEKSSSHSTGESIPSAEITNTKNTLGSNSALEDDEFVSPDLIDLIDAMEKKATQEKIVKPISSKPCVSSSAGASTNTTLGDVIKNCHEKSVKKMRVETNINQPSKKTLSLAGGVFKCTPEEIEKKRQEARKRLQLKKRQP